MSYTVYLIFNLILSQKEIELILFPNTENTRLNTVLNVKCYENINIHKIHKRNSFFYLTICI